MGIPLWFSNLVFWSVQVALLVLAAGILPWALKVRQPRVLFAYWRSLLATSLLLPVIEPWHRSPNGPPAFSADFVGLPLPAPSSPAAGHWHFPGLQTLAPILGMVILIGIALRFAILAVGLLKLRRIRQASLPISRAAESAAVLRAIRALVEAPAEFRLSAEVDSPVTFGFMAPVVLLPERFASLDPSCQSAIACHELLHVRRQDWAHHLAEEVLRGLLWFHPAIAWLLSRVRLAREQIVDLEVVRLTEARKPYLEALLEFTNGRSPVPAIPAPPFLAERQLVERVTLMLKEVRMSQKRLIISVSVISCCLALVSVLAAWTFPLKAQGVAGGITEGISPGVAGGVAKGIVGGVSGGISGPADTHHSDEPSVDVSTIWTARVKRGPMPLQVRGMGTLVRGEGSRDLVARVTLPASLAADVKPGQRAEVGSKNGAPANGRVTSVGPESNDTRTIDIALDQVPQGAAADLEVHGTIDLGRLENVLYVGRPVNGRQNSETVLFKIVNNGSEAVRTNVKLGRASVSTIEVLDGLKEGDTVIISDLSYVQSAERIRLTDEQHVRKN